MQAANVIWILLLCLVKQTYSQVYCGGNNVHVNITDNSTTATLNSNRPGEVYYGNDRHCVWHLNAPIGSRIQLTVKSSNIQWAPQDVAVCTDSYDYMSVDNVFPNGSTSGIVTWCGRRNPGSILSSTNRVRVIFHTNHQNVYDYTGIRLDYISFAGCPSGWSDYEGNCYFLHPAKLTWKEAQKHCGYSQANLVTIGSKDEQDFILSVIRGKVSSSEYTWIGLNDIAKEGGYQWITRTLPTYTAWPSAHSSRDDRDCVSMSSSGSWKEESCSKEIDQRRFVCEMARDTITGVFAVPIPNTDNKVDDDLPHWFQWQILVICVAIIAGLVAIAVIVFCVYKRKKSRSSRDTQVYENQVAMPSVSQPSRTAARDGVITRSSVASTTSERTRGQHNGPSGRTMSNNSAEMSAQPPSYEDAVQDGARGDGTHVHVHVHLPNAKTTNL